MKKFRSFILIAAFSAAISLPAFADNSVEPADASVAEAAPKKVSRQVNDGPKNELSVSYGTVTLLQFAYTFAGILGTAFSAGLAEMDDLKASGAVSLSYCRAVNKWLSVGADLAAEYVSLSFKNDDSEPVSNSPTIAFSPMLSLKGNWLRRDHFCLYSRLSGGVMFLDDVDDGSLQTPFAVQVSPVGMEFGGTGFRGFVEFGAGTQGILLGGLRYRF